MRLIDFITLKKSNTLWTFSGQASMATSIAASSKCEK